MISISIQADRRDRFNYSGGRKMQSRGKTRDRRKQSSIFQFDDTEKVPGQRQQIDVSKALLTDECKIEYLRRQ